MYAHSEIRLMERHLRRAQKQLKSAERIIYKLADVAEADFVSCRLLDSTVAAGRKLADSFKYTDDFEVFG